MRKYQGQLIFKTSDEHGDIEVVDEALYRSLHFGSEAKQSSMLLRDPIYLALSYTRAMSSALLFCDTPRRILLVGLGGGSLARFLLQHLPDCFIDAVELREAVFNVSRSHFQLADDPRLHVHITEGGQFVRSHEACGRDGYDLVFVDAFLGNGIARGVCGISFFDACHDLLNENGIFSMNLWNGDFITAREMREDIAHSFNGNLLILPVEGKDNTVALAGKGQSLAKQLKHLKDKAGELSEKTGIEYPNFIKQLKKQNRWLSW